MNLSSSPQNTVESSSTLMLTEGSDNETTILPTDSPRVADKLSFFTKNMDLGLKGKKK
jgi:hypothetical protein